MERRIQILNDDSVPGLSASYLDDDRGIGLGDLADLVLAGWNRSNVGALVSFARAISTTHPEFLEMVQGRRFRGLFAKSWASAFPELPASRALVARLEREKAVYEKDLADGEAESSELQLLLIREVIADNVAGFATTLGARDSELTIYRFVCPELPVWELLDWDYMTLAGFAFAMGAWQITRLLLGFFELVPDGDSLTCVLASGDEELIREIWVHTPDEVRAQCVGSWLKTAAALQLEVPFRWLLSLASEANLDEAVELMVEDRLVGALCEVEATGFDLARMRPARALHAGTGRCRWWPCQLHRFRRCLRQHCSPGTFVCCGVGRSSAMSRRH
jgi:hypothetical protein